MTRKTITTLLGFVAMGLLSSAASAMATAWDFTDRLTLNPHASAAEISDGPSTAVSFSEIDLDPDGLDAVPEIQKAPIPKSTSDIAGFDFADFNNDVKTLAYRTDYGLGLGLATTGGVTLTGGFATKDGMQVNVYYVRKWAPLSETAHEIGLDLNDQPNKAIGITVGWKF